MVTPRDVAGDVRRVLDEAEIIEGRRAFLSAYQILDRLPVRDRMLTDCEKFQPGDDALHLAASIITRALLQHLTHQVNVDVLDTNGVTIKVGSTTVGSKDGPSAVFRLAPGKCHDLGDRF